MNAIKREHWFIIIIVLAMTAWGGSWTSAKLISGQLPSEVIVFWRFFVTFISFIPVILYLKLSIRLHKIGFLQVLLGAFFLVIYNLLFFEGVRVGLAGAGGVIVTTLNPLITFVIAAILFKQKVGRKEKVGLMLGLLGGTILLEIWNGKLFNGGNVYYLLAALSWALLSIMSQKSKSNMSPLVFSFYTYGLSAIVDFFIAFPKGVFDFSQLNTSIVLNILYLSLGATTFGTTAYFIASSKLGASKASSFTFVVPASAILFSFIILDEHIKLVTIIGGILALCAVYLINIKLKPKKLPIK